MATKAIEDKKHEMEATMVTLGDKVNKEIAKSVSNSSVVKGWIKYTAGPNGCRPWDKT